MFGAVWFFFFYFFKEISYALQSYIFDKKKQQSWEILQLKKQNILKCNLFL